MWRRRDGAQQPRWWRRDGGETSAEDAEMWWWGIIVQCILPALIVCRTNGRDKRTRSSLPCVAMGTRALYHNKSSPSFSYHWATPPSLASSNYLGTGTAATGGGHNCKGGGPGSISGYGSRARSPDLRHRPAVEVLASGLRFTGAPTELGFCKNQSCSTLNASSSPTYTWLSALDSLWLIRDPYRYLVLNIYK